MTGNYDHLGGGVGGLTPNGKKHLKFPFWLLEPFPYQAINSSNIEIFWENIEHVIQHWCAKAKDQAEYLVNNPIMVVILWKIIFSISISFVRGLCR